MSHINLNGSHLPNKSPEHTCHCIHCQIALAMTSTGETRAFSEALLSLQRLQGGSRGRGGKGREIPQGAAVHVSVLHTGRITEKSETGKSNHSRVGSKAERPQRGCHGPGNGLHSWMEGEEAKKDGPLGEADVIIHQLLDLGIVTPWYGSTADFKEGHDS